MGIFCVAIKFSVKAGPEEEGSPTREEEEEEEEEEEGEDAG